MSLYKGVVNQGIKIKNDPITILTEQYTHEYCRTKDNYNPNTLFEDWSLYIMLRRLPQGSMGFICLGA